MQDDFVQRAIGIERDVGDHALPDGPVHWKNITIASRQVVRVPHTIDTSGGLTSGDLFRTPSGENVIETIAPNARQISGVSGPGPGDNPIRIASSGCC